MPGFVQNAVDTRAKMGVAGRFSLESKQGEIAIGARVQGSGGARIGTVDAVFADYALVRTAGLMPIDLYVPRTSITPEGDGFTVDCGAQEAYARWHRPLKRAPHD